MTPSFPRATPGASSARGAWAAVILAAWLSGCGGSPGTTVPDLSQKHPGLVLGQDSVVCSADPGISVAAGVSCEVTLQAQPPADYSQNGLDWAERPAGGSKVIEDVDRSIQPDGSWRLTVTFKTDQPAGTHTGTIEMVPSDLIAEFVPARLTYSFTMSGLDGTLSPLKPLSGGRDWATFGANAAHTGAVAVTLAAANFSRRWTRGDEQTGILSSVVTSQGRVYAGAQPTGTGTIHRVWSFNESDGTVAWSFGDETWFDPPATGSGRIYLSNSEVLAALDASTGALQYRRQHPAQPYPPVVSGMLAPTPHDTEVYAGNGADGELVRHDAATGVVAWSVDLRDTFEDPHTLNWTPAVTGDLVLTSVLGVFNAFDRTDGSKRFSVPVPGDTSGSILTMHLANHAPVVVDSDSVLLLDRRTGDGSPIANTLTMIDLSEHDVRWSATGQFTTPPVSGHGVVYAGNHATQRLEARDAATGETLWTWQAGAGEELTYKDLLLTDNLLFVSAGNTTYAIDLASRQAVWSYRAAGTLALSSNGVLYIVTVSDGLASNRLIAINLH